jgi:hypothetical protein
MSRTCRHISEAAHPRSPRAAAALRPGAPPGERDLRSVPSDAVAGMLLGTGRAAYVSRCLRSPRAQ